MMEAYYPGLTDDVQDSLVSHYEFENDVADSAGTNDGTDNTSAGFVNGIRGEAKDFDGTDDRVELPDLGLSSSSSFSLSGWWYHDTAKDAYLLGRFDGTDDQLDIITFTSSDTLQFDVGHAGGNRLQPSTTGITSGQWYHTVAVFDSFGPTAKIYLNGSLEASVTGTVDNFATGDGPWIGARSDSNGFTDGQIDDVRIYSKALSPAEVRQLYNWGRGVDFSGNENNGDVRGASAGNGVLGETAFSFDGSDDYVDLGDDSVFDFNNTKLTISAWINTSSSSDQTILTKYESTNDNGYEYRIDENSGWKMRFLTADGTTQDNVYGNTDVNDGSWHHVAVTYDNSSNDVQHYFDGRADGSGTVGQGISTNNIAAGIGKQVDNDTDHFNGLMSDVRVYKRILSPSEISYLYEVGQQGSIRFGGKVL